MNKVSDVMPSGDDYEDGRDTVLQLVLYWSVLHYGYCVLVGS